MKALVTGAAGFVGSHVSEALLAQGADVVGVDCFTDYYSRDLKERNLAGLRTHPKFTFHEAALQHTDAGALMHGVSQVYHLAAQAGVRKSWGADFRTYIDHNIDATQRLLEAAKGKPDLHRFVYASSSSVYGDVAPIPMREDAYLQPLSPYGVTKLAAEHLCHLYFANYGVPTVSLRPPTSSGPPGPRSARTHCAPPALRSSSTTPRPGASPAR